MVQCMFRALSSCLPNSKITPGTCPKSQKDNNIAKFLVLPRYLPGFLLKFRPDSSRIFIKMRPDEELVSLLFPNEELYGLSLGILTIQICFQLVTMLPLMFLSGQNIMGTPDLATRYGYCKVKFDLFFKYGNCMVGS